MFLLCALFDLVLDALDVSMTIILHPTHSHVLLHIQIVLGNFPKSLQTHQHRCFHPPPSVPLVRTNLEM
jgi:hypothetical protein